MKTHRKRQYVSGRIQGRLMFQIGVYWVLYHLFLCLAVFLYRYADDCLTSLMSEGQVSLQQLRGQFLHDFSPVMFCALATLPIVLLDMMKLTHRIAGPLVRFQNTLRKLSQGERVAPVKLRKGDLLTEFQDEFNNYLAGLPDRHQPSPREIDDEQTVAREVGELCQSVQAAARRPASVPG